MTTSTPLALDPETPLSVLRRFAITTIEEDMSTCSVAAEMPMAGMLNPFTGLPSVAGLAILVDDVVVDVNETSLDVRGTASLDLADGVVVAVVRDVRVRATSWCSPHLEARRCLVVGGPVCRW